MKEQIQLGLAHFWCTEIFPILAKNDKLAMNSCIKCPIKQKYEKNYCLFELFIQFSFFDKIFTFVGKNDQLFNVKVHFTPKKKTTQKSTCQIKIFVPHCLFQWQKQPA